MRVDGVLAALILAAAIPGFVMAQVNRVSVELDRREITVGGHVQAKLTLVWDGREPDRPPHFPDWQEKTWGDAEILAWSDVDSFDGPAERRIYSQTLKLTAFETGEIVLPATMVTLSVDGETIEVPTRDGVRFRVDSVLPDSVHSGSVTGLVVALDPKGAAPLRPLPGNGRFLWTAAALAGLCTAAALVLRRRVARQRAAESVPAAPPPPEKTPLEELLDALSRIDAEEGSGPAHTMLSFELRRFLGQVFAFNALESTTREVEEVLGHRLVWDELATDASQILRDCDFVKYAQVDVEPAVVNERLTAATELGREIDRNLRLLEREEAREAAAAA